MVYNEDITMRENLLQKIQERVNAISNREGKRRDPLERRWWYEHAYMLLK